MNYPNGTPSTNMDSTIWQSGNYTPNDIVLKIVDNVTAINKNTLRNSVGYEISAIQNFVNSHYLGRENIPISSGFINNLISRSGYLVVNSGTAYDSATGITIGNDNNAGDLFVKTHGGGGLLLHGDNSIFDRLTSYASNKFYIECGSNSIDLDNSSDLFEVNQDMAIYTNGGYFLFTGNDGYNDIINSSGSVMTLEPLEGDVTSYITIDGRNDGQCYFLTNGKYLALYGGDSSQVTTNVDISNTTKSIITTNLSGYNDADLTHYGKTVLLKPRLASGGIEISGALLGLTDIIKSKSPTCMIQANNSEDLSISLTSLNNSGITLSVGTSQIFINPGSGYIDLHDDVRIRNDSLVVGSGSAYDSGTGITIGNDNSNGDLFVKTHGGGGIKLHGDNSIFDRLTSYASDTMFLECGSSQWKIPASGDIALPADATDATTSYALVNAIKALLIERQIAS